MDIKKELKMETLVPMLHVYWMDNVLKNNDLLSQLFHNAQQAMLVCLPWLMMRGPFFISALKKIMK
mgnify:FL=1